MNLMCRYKRMRCKWNCILSPYQKHNVEVSNGTDLEIDLYTQTLASNYKEVYDNFFDIVTVKRKDSNELNMV